MSERRIPQDKAGDYPQGIPEELRAYRQWVCWRLEERNGKRTKVPHKAIGWGLASATDPTTWATFDDAIAAAERHFHSGIGFVFSADDPYAGIDLDGCRNPETGEVAPWAAEIVAMFPGAYVERSPSGTGIHIITRGTAPHNGKQPYQGCTVEMYDRGRYFTVTGVPL